jgi:spore coat protein CotH
MIRSFLISLFIASGYIATAQGDHFFTETALHEIRLVSLHPSDWDSIAARYEREMYTPMHVVIDGITLDSVGVRIKGNNFLNYPEKGKFQAYKLDFNEFVKGQKYDGLKKINLNNREKLANHLAFRLCRENGIIAHRTSFSKVYFDGVFIGNYLNLEQIDDTFLNQHIGTKNGNLYSASGKGGVLEYMGPLKEDYYYAYEKKTNEAENDYSDLLSLLDFFSNCSDRAFEDSVDQHIDFSPFLMSVVIEMTVCKRDAFYDAGRNFYLYHNPRSSRFIYIPDDFDYSFSNQFGFNLNFLNDQSPHLGDVSNVIIDRFLRSEKLKNLYYNKVCQFLNGSFDPDSLNGYIGRMEALEKVWDFDFEDFSMRTTDEIRDFITQRKTKLESDFMNSSFSCNPNTIEVISPFPEAPVVYPNPADANLTIRFTEANTEFHIALTDLRGRFIYSAGNLHGRHDVSMALVPSGVYSLQIRTIDRVQCVKIIKL